MRRFKSWFVSTVFLLMNSMVATAQTDLLNIASYAEGDTSLGEDLVVSMVEQTGEKYLTGHYGIGQLKFPVNLSSEFEVSVKMNCQTVGQINLFLATEESYIQAKFQCSYSSIYIYFQGERSDDSAWVPNAKNEVKISVKENIVRLYINDVFSNKFTLNEGNLTYTKLLINGITSDSALYEVNVSGGSYGGTGGTGSTGGSATGVKLINISTRAPIQGGAEDVIAGFIISGTGSQKVLIKGMSFEADVDVAITLQKYPSGDFVAYNNNWQTQTAPSTTIPAQWAMPQVTDSALLLTLPAGAYTAILSAGAKKGLGLIGVNAID